MTRLAGILQGLAIALFLCAAAGAPSEAKDIKVHYGEGQFGRYQEQMANLLARRSELEEKINALAIRDFYCIGDHPGLQDAKDELAALRQAYKELLDDYKALKQGLSKLAKTPKLLTGFDLSKTTPENPNFWHNANREMATPEALLAAKEAQLKKARVIDCSKKSTAKPPGPSGAEEGGVSWPPVKPSEPLKGFERPPIDDVPFPTPPDHFCSEKERSDYYDQVFEPLFKRAYKSAKDALGYRADISHAHLPLVQQIYQLEHEAKPGTVNPNLLADLKRQERILQQEIDSWEPTAQQASDLYYRFLALAQKLLKWPVIDCGPKTTGAPPPPPPPPESGKAAMSEPLPLDLHYPHAPDEFCSKAEKEDFLKLLQPMIERARAQAAAWAAYAAHTGYAVARNMAESARNYLDALEDMKKQVERAKIIDCRKKETGGGETVTPPPPQPEPGVAPPPKKESCPKCQKLANDIAILEEKIAGYERQKASIRKYSDLSDPQIQDALKDIDDKIDKLRETKAKQEKRLRECERKCDEQSSGSPLDFLGDVHIGIGVGEGERREEDSHRTREKDRHKEKGARKQKESEEESEPFFSPSSGKGCCTHESKSVACPSGLPKGSKSVRYSEGGTIWRTPSGEEVFVPSTSFPKCSR